MSVQQFCLRWNNHQPNFISVCSSLLHNGTLVDVTLAAEGRQLQAHKIVLSACSSYFQTLFTSNPCQHPIVILKDVQYDDLKTMVDFMYYGEVNVSQEQLPHILKTAEMLKIKGLAEMPTDPANLTKSESKSSNEPTDLVGSGSTGSNGQSSSGVNSGGMGSSAGGSINETLWEPQHHHGQHSETQFQTHPHQQQQNSQTQTSQQQQQQHHQLRRTPSPLGAGASPATRRKRLRKSSNNGSGDRTNSDEQHTSLDSGNNTGGISLTQMGQMSFGTTGGTISGMPTHTLHATKLLKESSSTEVEPHPQDDSLDGGHGHVHMQIKPEVDMSSVQQSMPLDISAATTPSEHDAPNSQSSHSDISQPSNANVSTIVAQPECSPRAVNMAMSPSPTSLLSQQQQQHSPVQLQHQHSQQQQQMGTKRNRVLTRQPRVKRDSDSLSNAQVSPEPHQGSGVDFDPFSNSPGGSSHSNYIPAHALQLHPSHHHLLTVPTRIERHSSEPAPSLTPSSPHLLSVPQSTPFLMKQHSDPLLPTQHSLSGAGALIVGGGTNPFAPLHRQYSHPLSCTTSGANSSAGTSHITSVPLHHSHHISLPESMYTSGGSPPPVGSSQYVVPQQIVSSGSSGTSNEIVGAGSASSASPSKVLSIPHFTTTYIDDGDARGRNNSPSTHSSMGGVHTNTSTISSAPLERVRSAESNTPPPTTTSKIRSSKSTSSVMLSERMSSLHPGAAAMGSSSFEHLPSLRVKSEELQRSVSSPQTSQEIITLENPRSSHCPVIRPGPALGCNFCWNTIDGHGRILRRKTKYHCPECQTNLCIVPCFQEYHERQNNEAANTSTGNDGNSSKSYSGTTGRSGNSGSGGNSTRLYSKTESI